MDMNVRLCPSETAEMERALAHELKFDRRDALKVSGEMMSKTTATHLLACLERAGFVVMKRSPFKG